MTYNLKHIRTLLTDGFSREELLLLCFDVSELRFVYDNVTESNTKTSIVLSIIDHAHKHLIVDLLLNWAKSHNPLRYEMYQPYFEQDHGEIHTDAPLSNVSLVHILPDNKLGYGLVLGGTYRGTNLHIVATEIVAYGISWMRTGWLFVPQLTPSHAVAFYKLHIRDDGSGYIHIIDASDQLHAIWLTTGTGVKLENRFHFRDNPVAVWPFNWQ